MPFMNIKDGLGVWLRAVTRSPVRRAERELARPRLEGLEPRLQFSGVAQEIGDAPVAAPVEPRDLLPDLIPWVSRENGYVYGWRLDRAERPGKVLLRLTSAMANIGEGPMELRGGEPTEDGAGQEVFQRIHTSDGESHDRLAGVFRYHPSHNHTHFDNFALYRLRYVTEGNGVGRTVKAGNKVSFCLTDSDAYDLSLPNAPENGRFYSCGTRKQGISVGWADVYDESLPDQFVNVTGVEPGRYWLEVVVDPKDRILEMNEDNNVARIAITLRDPTPPGNDLFSNAAIIEGTQVVARASNENASREDGEPRHGGGSGGASIWWAWTAPETGEVTITTRGSEMDTLLGVYRGKSVGNLDLIAGNDDARGEVTSRVGFVARKGVTYFIAVDGYRGATGDVRLTLRQEI